jgi:hypothetical protein
MADPTPLDIIEIESLFPDDGTELTFSAGDAVNGNSYPSTGREVVLMENTDDTDPFDVVVTSQPDANGRTGDLTITLTALQRSAVMLATKGWRDGDRNVVLTAEDSAVTFCVVRLPIR